jgi:hypothetical protein
MAPNQITAVNFYNSQSNLNTNEDFREVKGNSEDKSE